MIARLLVEKILLLYIKYKIASCDKFTLNYFIFSFGPTLNNYSSFGPTLKWWQIGWSGILTIGRMFIRNIPKYKIHILSTLPVFN